MNEKRNWWVKFTERFFLSENVDYLMSQKGGSAYVLIYLSLCLKTVNTEGILARRLEDVVVIFDNEKIQRDLKYWSLPVIKKALQYFQDLGLIKKRDDGVLYITDYERLIGSESTSTERVRNWRKDNQ